MNTSQRLKSLILAESTLVMPDAYDPISARIIEHAGFEAVQCSGYSFAISYGYGKETDVSFTENIEKTKRIVEAVRVPVMADGEDGFGEGDVLKSNIRKYIESGAAGTNIEDQNLRNPAEGKIISESRMLEKIARFREAAAEAGNPDFVLNARTDALGAFDTKEKGQMIAIERANKYLEAGATLCFITHINTLEQVKLFAKEVHGPISVAAGVPYNIAAFSIRDCCELGIARVSLPTVAILGSVKSLLDIMQSIRDTKGFDELASRSALLSDMSVLKNLLH
ncbi:MAG: isocitrate lyase/phosphoenolpyruvate mutase family protein [Candidatus Hydrogenedentes bacterium]|nr:isocitrate lyase/phosphoenolpyruvate mutase family protein [Candidatus Hydrogenedentota bacterium]